MAYDCDVPILSVGEFFRGIKAEEGIPVVFEGGSLDKAQRFTVGTISPAWLLYVGDERYLHVGTLPDGSALYRIAHVTVYPVWGRVDYGH